MASYQVATRNRKGEKALFRVDHAFSPDEAREVALESDASIICAIACLIPNYIAPTPLYGVLPPMIVKFKGLS